jgi:hypothetical protein
MATIVLDFDGTCITHAYPAIGKDIGAIPVLKELNKAGHGLILFTMRSSMDGTLEEAVKWFKDNEIKLYGIQTHPTQHKWTTSPKAYGEFMIDDSAIGCPTKFDLNLSNREFVDWEEMKNKLIMLNLIK